VVKPDPPQINRDTERKLSGALARLEQKVHYEGVEDLCEAAGWVAYSVARSHAFIDGNKRTGVAAMDVFIYLNENIILKYQDIDLGKRIEALVDDASKYSLDDFIVWLRSLGTYPD